MGFTTFRRVRTYRRNGGIDFLVRTYTAYERKSLLYKTFVTYPNDRKKSVFFLSTDGAVSQNSSRPCRNIGKRSRQLSDVRQRSPQRPHYPRRAPRESPRHFAASMDESVIVGYYTSAEVPFQSYLSANPKERKEKYGKK